MANPRLMQSGGRVNIERAGLRYSPFSDLYHYLMVSPWWAFIAWLLIGWLLFNLVFALLFLAGGDVIHSARPGRFDDAFYFSVHTMATIGYGTMSPDGQYANLVVMAESFLAMLGQAVMTGLCFAKFSRPTARVMFSRYAVITRRDGQNCLLFRMANGRANQVVQAQLQVVLTYNDTTPEGEPTRRLVDLQLKRANSPFFVLSWIAIHVLDESSPLAHMSVQQMEAAQAEIFVTFSGIDETFSQTIYARSSYTPDQLRYGYRFVDILSTRPDGNRRIDYAKFDEVIEDVTVS